MFDNDPKESTQELLNIIQRGATQGCNTNNLNIVIPTVSALLVRLSKEASKTADKNIKIQKRMIILTAIILAISISQLVFSFLQFSQKSTVYSQSVISAPHTITPQEHRKYKENPEKEIKEIHDKPPSINSNNMGKNKTITQPFNSVDGKKLRGYSG